MKELTSLGAAFAAGLAEEINIYHSLEDITHCINERETFRPMLSGAGNQSKYL